MANTALNRTTVALLTNKSGGSVAQGDVVIVDSANASAFTTTTTGSYAGGSIGVVLEPNGIASNATGTVAFAGYVPIINLSSSASLGDVFHTHTVAKQAIRHAAPVVAGDFGQVLGTGTTPAALLWGEPSGGGGASGPAGKLGYAQITSNFSTSSTSPVDVTSLSVAVTIGTRAVKVTFFCSHVSNNTTGTQNYALLIDVTAGVQVAQGRITESGVAGGGYQLTVMAANLTPAAGSRTYKVQMEVSAGTGSINAGATSPAFILVEEI